MTDLLKTMLQKLDESLAKYSELDKYYAGEQALSYLSPEARAALGNRLQRVGVNIPRLLVDSIAERLRIVGFDGPAGLWDEWLYNDLDQQSGVVHREAGVLGRSYVMVWARPDGTASVTAESARQVAVLTEPGSRRVYAAVKRWETPRTTEATLFEPDRITRLSANATGATIHGFKTVEVLDNPLQQVPIVPFVNSSRLLDDGRSEMQDVLSLTDAVTKLLGDMMVGSEYGARPRRWATGLELGERDVVDESGNATGETESVNPIAETDRMMVNEDSAGKFGQLSASDLAAYETAVGVLMRQISAVSGLPPHVLGVAGDANPTSADSIRASEAALTAKAEARQQAFGRSWEEVGRLIVGVRDGVDPAFVDVRVRWADAATRSVAQEADAITKLYQAGLLPASYALRRLGYSDEQIDEIRLARTADSLDRVDIASVLS